MCAVPKELPLGLWARKKDLALDKFNHLLLCIGLTRERQIDLLNCQIKSTLARPLSLLLKAPQSLLIGRPVCRRWWWWWAQTVLVVVCQIGPCPQKEERETDIECVWAAVCPRSRGKQTELESKTQIRLFTFTLAMQLAKRHTLADMDIQSLALFLLGFNVFFRENNGKAYLFLLAVRSPRGNDHGAPVCASCTAPPVQPYGWRLAATVPRNGWK